MKAKPERYQCPNCRWDFSVRKKRCCPGCGVLLLIGSDAISDADLIPLKNFWIWEPGKEKWIFVHDWSEHKQEAARKFERYVKSGSTEATSAEIKRPLKKWIH